MVDPIILNEEDITWGKINEVSKCLLYGGAEVMAQMCHALKKVGKKKS